MRRIDSKFSVNSDLEIVKTTNGEIVPRNEPLFLLRARDYLAIATLDHYRRLCELDGCTDYQLSGIDKEIRAFKEYAERSPEKMKQPGVTRGA